MPVIFTNKHVVNNNQKEEVNFFLHAKNGEMPDDEKLNIKFKTDWYFHDNQDLCFCFIAPLLQQIKDQKQKDIFYISLREDLIWNDLKLEELSAIDSDVQFNNAYL